MPIQSLVSQILYFCGNHQLVYERTCECSHFYHSTFNIVRIILKWFDFVVFIKPLALNLRSLLIVRVSLALKGFHWTVREININWDTLCTNTRARSFEGILEKLCFFEDKFINAIAINYRCYFVRCVFDQRPPWPKTQMLVWALVPSLSFHNIEPIGNATL